MQEYFTYHTPNRFYSFRKGYEWYPISRNILNAIWKTSTSGDVFNLPCIEFLFVLLSLNFSNTRKK